MKITSAVFTKVSYTKENAKKEQENSTSNYKTANTLLPMYNDHLLYFTARVDKGLERFYDANKERMPQTVKEYVETLDDKSKMTPLEAQQKAFELLEISQSIEDIKSAYPNEELFTDLINPNESKARRGILNSVKENEELLALSNQGVLKDKSNLTVYLVKKVFLEDKTIEEINQDLDKDLDEDFKADFKFKNPNSQYVYVTTLASLGIKTPNSEYRQSLRYTRDGYSDSVGDKISEGQKRFWDIEKFENWWGSLTRNQKLELIADQITELEMLKLYKKEQRAKEKEEKLKNNETTAQDNSNPTQERKHNKIGSKKLSQDELFIKWASNNLKIYQENLSEAEKDTLHIKRMQRLTARWANMTPTERTDYISKMKSGSEPLRYTMIDAWNHSKDLIKDLSTHLRQNQIYKPADILYSTQEFSEFQSKVMTEFWESHPEHATALGKNITNSQEKIQRAIQSGTFEELKKQIMRDKNQRIKEMEKFKETIKTTPSKETTETPEYFKDFKNTYYKVLGGQLKNLPPKYINDYFKSIENSYTQEEIEAWTRNMKGEPMLEGDRELLQHISQTESKEGAKINRALEAAGADILYNCTKNPEVYLFSHSDIKVALNQISRGEQLINIGSHKLNRQFEMPLLKNKIDYNRLNSLYNQYYENLNEKELDNIIDGYFFLRDESDDEQRYELEEYIQSYGKSANIIFSDKSIYPKEIKAKMYEKFVENMPNKLYNNVKCSLSNTTNAFEREEQIKRAKYEFTKKYEFIPKLYMDSYLHELGKIFRTDDSVSLDTYIEKCCKKRKDPKERGKIANLSKTNFNISNKIRTLAMEETLADILYDATGNSDVYTLGFEELCDNIEVFNLVKKFPSESRHFNSKITGKEIELIATKRLNLNNIQRTYIEYLNEIIDWVNTDVKNNQGTFEDLLYILNPEENMPEKDAAVTERIKVYNLNLK